MAKKWVMVRIKASTHARLCAYRDRLMQSYYEGRRSDIGMEGDTFSLSAAISVMLKNEEDHRERSKKSSRKRPTTNGEEGK